MPKTEIPGMGKRTRVYAGIYRYFTIPVYTLRNTPAAIACRLLVRAESSTGRLHSAMISQIYRCACLVRGTCIITARALLLGLLGRGGFEAGRPGLTEASARATRGGAVAAALRRAGGCGRST